MSEKIGQNFEQENNPEIERAEKIKNLCEQIKDEIMDFQGGGAIERNAAQNLLFAMNSYLNQIRHGKCFEYEDIDLKLKK